MKQNVWFALVLSFSLLLIDDTVAQNIYIAPNGNDQHSGTAEQPLATLTAARDRIRLLRKQNPSARHAWQVIIRKGEYMMPETLNLSVDDSGTETSPLLFKGEEGAAPVFYGGFYLNKFEKISDSLWKTDVPEVRRYGWRFEQLYINGTRVTRAQTPNNGFYKPIAVKETVMVKGDGRSPELAVQQIKIPGDAANWMKDISEAALKDAVITFYHHWDNTKKPLQMYNAADSSIYISGEGMKPWNPITTASLFAIENLQSALDAPGEWFLDRSGTLYYRPRPGETIEATTAMAPLLDKFVTITGDAKTGEKSKRYPF